MTVKVNENSWLDTVQIYVNTLNHMLIAMISAYTSWLCIQVGPSAISWHTWLTTIGYQLLMCESLLSLYKHNSWSGQHVRRTKQNLHWILQAVGSVFAIGGMITVYMQLDVHLNTLHSKLGFASGIFTILGVLNGTSAIWAPNLRTCIKPVYTRLCHNVTGTLAFVLGMASLIYGFNKFPFRHFSPSMDVVIWMQVMCGLTILFCMIGPSKSLWSQLQGVMANCCRRQNDDDDDGDEVTTTTADYATRVNDQKGLA